MSRADWWAYSLTAAMLLIVIFLAWVIWHSMK
jgi:hypothetical protein